MTIESSIGKSQGVAFLVSGGIVYEIVAAACSSPQTTELNADRRAKTLMKWVHIGLAQAAVFVVAASILDRQHSDAILSGGALAGGLMYVSYVYAKESGLKSGAPGTESY